MVPEPARREARDPQGADAGAHSALARARVVAELAARLLGADQGRVWFGPGTGTTAHEAETGAAVEIALGDATVLRHPLEDGRPAASGLAGVPALLAVPVVGDDEARLGVLYVVASTPHRWAEREVTLLEALATGVAEAVELAALRADVQTERAHADLALESAGVGSFDWDVRAGLLQLDERIMTLFGYPDDDSEPTIEGFFARVHPDDRDGVRRALDDALAGTGQYESEYRIIRADGSIRWVTSRGRAFADEDGAAARLVGVAQDTTGLRGSEALVARVLETMPNAFYSVDREWRLTYVNAQAERLLLHPRRELLGRRLWEVLPQGLEASFGARYREALDTGEPSSFEAFSPAPLERWYDVRVWPGPEGLSVYFHDITESRAARERLALLEAVASELAGTLDAAEAVARLARLVVPTLAEWCIVTLVDERMPGPTWSRLRDIGWWHADPELRPVVHLYAELRLRSLTEESFVAQAVVTGEPVVRRGGATEAICTFLGPGPAQDTFRVLAPDDAVVLPLRAHGRTLGILSLYGPPAPGLRLRGAADELRTELDVAARAGLALDNARLYEQQRGFSEGLQRSLLTPPPQVPGLEIAVRYLPAAEAARVGGDWYDAFCPRPGVTMVVIGDVVGHDMVAAAAMGQLRAILRGVAATTGEGPAAVLGRVDRALETLAVELTATVLVVSIEQDTGPGGEALVRWCSAGHPTPLLMTPDGEVVDAAVAGFRPNILIGVRTDLPRQEHRFVMPGGSTLVLFTDGLVERRGERYKVGAERLRSTLRDLGPQEIGVLCDALLDRVMPASPQDDVALAAVRTVPS